MKIIKDAYNKYYKNSEYGRNILTLMTGTTLAQAIPIAISPILTRLFSPDDFGVYALYISIVSIFSILATGRYEMAIILPKKDKAAAHVLALSMGLAFLISAILFVIIYFFNNSITILLKNPEISFYLYFVPLSIFLTSCYNALNQWLNRVKKYKSLAGSRVVTSIGTATPNLIFGYLKFSEGLIVSNIIGQSAVVTYLLKKSNLFKNSIFVFSKEKLSYVAKRYSKFPKFEMFSGFFNMASSQVPIILLNSFFGNAISGLYSLSNRILSLPMSLLGSSISQVYLQKSSTYRDEPEKLKSLTFSTFKKLLLIGVLPLSTVTVFGDYLFSIVFGAEWEIAGVYSQILAVWILLVFISSPLSTILITLEKQEEAFFFNASIFIARVVALLTGALIYKSALISVILFSATGAIFWLFLIFYILSLVKIKFIKILFTLFIPLISVHVILYLLRILIELFL